MPTCCRELADRSGDVARARADRIGFSQLRSGATDRVAASLSDAHNTLESLPLVQGTIVLTALSCRRTFADSAVKKASFCRRRSVPH